MLYANLALMDVATYPEMTIINPSLFLTQPKGRVCAWRCDVVRGLGSDGRGVLAGDGDAGSGAASEAPVGRRQSQSGSENSRLSGSPEAKEWLREQMNTFPLQEVTQLRNKT